MIWKLAGNRPSGLVLLTDRYEDPQRWRRLMQSRARGAIRGAAADCTDPRPSSGVMMGIGTALNPFSLTDYKALESLPIVEQRQRLRDPELRRKILAEKPPDAEIAKLAQFRQLITKRWDKFFTMGDPPDYEPDPEKSVAAIAARTGCTADEVAYDYIPLRKISTCTSRGELCGGRPRADPRNALRSGLCTRPEQRRRALHLDFINSGLPEFHAGAFGAGFAAAGKRLPLEYLVKRQTSETADFFGLSDRGKLVPGLRADVNIIDFKHLRLHKPELVHDMPAGGQHSGATCRWI